MGGGGTVADILHKEIFSSLYFRVQSCPRVGGAVAPFSYTTVMAIQYTSQATHPQQQKGSKACTSVVAGVNSTT